MEDRGKGTNLLKKGNFLEITIYQDALKWN